MALSAKTSTEFGIEVVRLSDNDRQIEIAIAVTFGNRPFEMKVRGENVLYFPHPDVSGFHADPRSLNGIPFLAPWANRAADGALHIHGKVYPFNHSTGTLRLDANGLPIHGMLYASPLWRVIDLGADDRSAYVISRLEFWKYPALIANWPFAHSYEMTCTLSEGGFEVRTAIISHCAEPMPIAVGFHPYFNLPGVPRDESVAHIPVRSHIETDSRLVPTGELTPANFADRISLRDHRLDDGFTGIDAERVFYIEGCGKRIEVKFSPQFPVAIVYAPAGHEYICFEPMAAPTNGINLADAGKYSALQWLEPGGIWSGSFRISVNGF